MATKNGFVRTTGELRQRLAESILDLRAGKITVKEADAISAQAGKINRRLAKQLKDAKAKRRSEP